jgi:glycosyltransferase 2 family protein
MSNGGHVSQGAVETVIVEPASAEAIRSPADVLRLVVAVAVLLVLLGVQWLFGDTLTRFAADLLSGLGAIPDWIVNVVIVGTRVLVVVVIGGGFVVTLLRGRWRFLFTVGAAAVIAGALAWLLDRIGPSPATDVIHVTDVLAPINGRGFPSGPGVAVAAAIVTAAAPWVARRWRRAGWALVIGLALTRFLSGPISFDALRGVLIGWVVGAAVLVIFGGPSRRPTSASIAAGLGAVGAPLARLEPASVDARGSTPYFATATDGRKLFVKALGEDQRSADLLFRLYRYATRRQLGDERPFSTLRRTVEHEAFVALAADAAGVRTPRFVALATADPNAFVLAYEAIDGKSLDSVAPDDLSDAVLEAIWGQVKLLRAHRIAHRDLRLANVFLAADGEAWAIDFGFSELAASDLLLANDLAELTTSLASVVGVTRSVDHAARAVGPAGLAPALDRLHPWALSGATRTAIKAQPGLLDDVRTQVRQVAERA